jgi:hypothetical protein
MATIRLAPPATDEEGWVIVGRPFEKFFNQQESECPVASAKVFDANCSSFGMAEKADGTCIQFWWSSPATLDAVYETALQMEAAAAAAKSEAGVNVADDEEEANEVEKEDVEVEEESDGMTAEGGAGFQGLGKASLIEKRARRFKKVLPRVLQATADSQQQGEGLEAPKHARGLVRKPQHYHVRAASLASHVDSALTIDRTTYLVSTGLAYLHSWDGDSRSHVREALLGPLPWRPCPGPRLRSSPGVPQSLLNHSLIPSLAT